MNKAVEQDLVSLLPSLSGPLPPKLRSLAASLLAQSRSKASSLKPEEEIARGYACAHLACEKLKKQLDLPPIVQRPPVAPRVYKKVYAYISAALANATTPRTARFQDNNGGDHTPTATTPSKRKRQHDSLAHTPVGASTRHLDAAPKQKADDGPELPSWTMPTIRALCRALDAPAAAPHVFAGVASVWPLLAPVEAQPETPSRKRHRRSEAAAQAAPAPRALPALIAVLTFYTLSALADPDPDADTDAPPDEQQYLAQRDTALRVLRAQVPPEHLADAGGDAPDPLVAQVERLMREAQPSGWLDMEWFRNVVPAWRGADGEGTSGEGEDEDVGIAAQRGFGAMLTDATDWLSESRRRDYVVWKKGILRRMREIGGGE